MPLNKETKPNQTYLSIDREIIMVQIVKGLYLLLLLWLKNICWDFDVMIRRHNKN